MVTETESGFLSPTDQKFFVIHTSNSDQLIDVVAVQEEENFTYTDLESQGFNLDFGTTYYLSTVITKLDDQGAPILDPAINPCMGVARGVPIKFYDIPEVTISLEKETACIDEEVNLLFETNSDALYNVSILGTEFLNFDIENGDTRRVSASATTDFVVEYIEIIGVEGGCGLILWMLITANLLRYKTFMNALVLPI